MKKFLIAFMAVLLILPVLLNTTAAHASNSINKEQQINQQQTSEFTWEDIQALKPYISVKNGLFKLDSNSAKKDGNNKELIKGQKDYLSDLNEKIKKGELEVESNLEIVSLEPLVADSGFSILASCPGKSSSKETYHWWGTSRYLNNCQANKFAADLSSVAVGYTGAGIVAGIWFPAVGVAGGLIAVYAGLMSSRVYANNEGKGVYAAITYASVFNIEPQ